MKLDGIRRAHLLETRRNRLVDTLCGGWMEQEPAPGDGSAGPPQSRCSIFLFFHVFIVLAVLPSKPPGMHSLDGGG